MSTIYTTLFSFLPDVTLLLEYLTGILVLRIRGFFFTKPFFFGMAGAQSHM
jgi:hypothetical protein